MSAMKRLVAAFAATILLWAQPAAAQSILRDAETESMFNDMSRPLILAAGLSPNNVQIVLINDDSINAFVAGGQIVYIHSGLLKAADNANQVQGVIAHELGHIADGHVVLQDAGVKPALGISILSMVLGIAAIRGRVSSLPEPRRRRASFWPLAGSRKRRRTRPAPNSFGRPGSAAAAC